MLSNVKCQMTKTPRKLLLSARQLLVVVVCLCWSSTSLTNTDEVDYSTEQSVNRAHISEPTGRLIVKYRSNSFAARSPRGNKRFTRALWREQNRLGLERPMSGNRELVKIDAGFNAKSLKLQAQQMTNLDEIEYASVEYRRYPLLEPNDPLYQGAVSPGNQSYLHDGPYSMRAPGAWDITTGSGSSVIAIVDTGVLPNHQEINGRSIAGLGYDFVSADNPGDFFSANDGDGRDDDPTDPGDPCFGVGSSWHGTSVASTAAGNTNDGLGMASVDWNAQLLHARALGICGGTDADIIDAIRWSAGLPIPGVPDNPTPANVVNLSLGGPTECTPAWQEVIDELTDRNVVFVMAAGNESMNALRSAPANCSNVITVGSITRDGLVDRGFSNYGIKVTVATAGRDIVVAANQGFDTADSTTDFYRTETGTSFSAALVSGAISLMHSLDPTLGPNEVRALLQETASDYAPDSGCDTLYCGGGILNLSSAINAVSSGTYDTATDRSLELITTQATPITLQQQTDAGLFGYRDIRYFSLNVPEAGLLQVESTGSRDIYGYLLNDELSVVALDDDNGDATNFRLASVVAPGNYYIAVERSRHRLADGELQFSLAATVSSDSPTPFTFASVTNASTSSTISSGSVRIEGLVGESIVTVQNGFYTINNGPLLIAPSTISNGDSITLWVQSPSAANTNVSATVSVGAYSTTFTVTTAGPGDTGPPVFVSGPMSGGNAGSSSSGCSFGTGTLDPLFILLTLVAVLGISRRHLINITSA